MIILAAFCSGVLVGFRPQINLRPVLGVYRLGTVSLEPRSNYVATSALPAFFSFAMLYCCNRFARHGFALPLFRLPCYFFACAERSPPTTTNTDVAGSNILRSSQQPILVSALDVAIER